MSAPRPWLDCFPVVEVYAHSVIIQIDPIEQRDRRRVPRALIAGEVQAGDWLNLCQPISSGGEPGIGGKGSRSSPADPIDGDT